MANRSKVLNACAIIIASCLVIACVAYIFGIISEDKNYVAGYSGVWCCYITTMLILMGQRRRKRWYYLSIMIKENIKMDASVFNELTGKTVRIRTLDEYIKGEIIGVSGDFVKIEKKTKKGSDVSFVNVNTVESVKIINQTK